MCIFLHMTQLSHKRSLELNHLVVYGSDTLRYALLSDSHAVVWVNLFLTPLPELDPSVILIRSE